MVLSNTWKKLQDLIGDIEALLSGNILSKFCKRQIYQVNVIIVYFAGKSVFWSTPMTWSFFKEIKKKFYWEYALA